MIVRRATGNDVPWLLQQCKQFCAFSGDTLSLFPDDLTAVEKLTALMNEDVGCFFVAEQEGPRTNLGVGFIVGILAPHYFNPALLQLTELLWWVSPEHRGSRAGALLLKAYLDYGEEHGAHRITMTLEAESPINPAALTKRGFRLKETNYLRELVA